MRLAAFVDSVRRVTAAAVSAPVSVAVEVHGVAGGCEENHLTELVQPPLDSPGVRCADNTNHEHSGEDDTRLHLN